MNWVEHIDFTSSKISQRLGLICRIKQSFPLCARLTLYDSPALPLFDYADIVCMVWVDKNNVNLMNHLQVIPK
jgi:hypothetical protein